VPALDAPASRTDTPADRPTREQRRWILGVVLAVLALAVAYLTWRGIFRGATISGDLVVGYSSAVAWLQGHDPYDVGVLVQDALIGGGSAVPIARLDELRNVYFPTTIPIFVPIAWLPWTDARLVWLALNLLSTVFIALGLARLAGWGVMTVRTLAFCAVVFALAPVHTTMALGQTALAATAALVAALMLERAGRDAWAGLLYGVATAVKIQIGLPFLVYLAWRRRWFTVLPAFTALAGLTLLSLVRMELAQVGWLQSWISNLRVLSGPGGLNDPSQLNPERYSLISLEYPLHSWFNDPAVVTVISILVVGAGAAILAWIVRGPQGRAELLTFGTVGVIGLLATYHRYYDAVLLALPIAWAMSVLGTVRWRGGAVVLVLCADFLVPAQTALHDLQDRGLVPAGLTETWIWQTVIMAQHAWALLLLAGVLLVAAARTRRLKVTGPPIAAT
jgi:hypothetical protein